jgi:deoxyhypusine synthase
MTSAFPLFDRSALKVLPLSERRHDLSLSSIRALAYRDVVDANLREVAERVKKARKANAAVVLMMGAHVIRSGVQRFLIDMMARGLVSCLAMNGAGVIHDFEFALVGGTTESVPHYISDGKFGLWQETSRLNDIISEAARSQCGLGEAVGRVIEEESFPHKDISVVAAGYRFSHICQDTRIVGRWRCHEFRQCGNGS